MSSSASLRLHPYQYQRTQSCPLPRIQSPSSTFSSAYGSGSKAWLEDAACWERRARLEQEFTSNFQCCGLQLQDLHSLLEHFETAHQPQSMTLDLEFPSLSCPASPLDVEFPTAQASASAASALEKCLTRANARATSPEAVDSTMPGSMPFHPLSPPASPGSLEPLDVVVMPSQFANRGAVAMLDLSPRTMRPPTPVSDHDHLSDAEHDHVCDDEPPLLRALTHPELFNDTFSTATATETALCAPSTPAAEAVPMPKSMAKPSSDSSHSLPPGVLPIYSPSSIPSFRVDMKSKMSNKCKLAPLPFSASDSMSTTELSSKTCCPVVGCPKKYSSTSGLRYHLQHAHDGLAQSLLTKRRKYAPY